MMTGRKETKAEKSSSQRSGGGNGGGGSNVSETGALFPRLHVKETKRVGPRAPPRNKMALYEQFTFPSSRFMPPSLPLPASGRPAATPAATTTYGSQRSSYDGCLLYGLHPSLNGMPWMPYTAVNNASPSVNGSSNSTVVDCEKESHQRPGVPEASTRPPSNAVGQGSSWVPSQSNVSSVSCKRSRSNDDCTVPTLTPLSASYGPSVPTVRTHQHAWQAWPQRSIDTSNTCQQVSVSSGCQVESGLASLRTNHGAYSVSVAGGADGEAGRDASWKTEKRAQVEDESELRDCTNDEIERDSMQMRSSDAEVSETHRHASRRHRHHGQKALQSEALNCTSKGPKSCTIPRGDSLAASGNDGKDVLLQKKVAAMVDRSVDFSTKIGKVVKGDVEEMEMKEKPSSDARDRRKRGNPSECKSSSFAGGDDEVEIISTDKASEPSQSNAWSDGAESDSSMSGHQEVPRMFRRISSRHMINIIGEQEFWRTRKLLQRQQKIFSGQIFELHRLIKVQQLLASSADVLMDQGIVGDCDEMAQDSPEPANAHEVHTDDDEDDEEDDAHDIGTVGGDQEGPESAMGKHPDSTCQSSTSPRVCLENAVANPAATSDRQKAEVPAVPIITPGESSASWAGTPFPKAGVNNWFGAVPAPSGAYVYQPYPGPFHPPPAHAMGGYSGAYRPVMCAPGPMDMPSMNPYCMPRFEQPDLMQDMYRYNAYSQQWPPAMLCQPVGSNPGASWYGVPPPIPFLDPGIRGPYGWYEDVASGAHPAGPNYLRPAHQSTAQGMPVPRAPAFVVQPPWTEVSNSQQTGNDGEGFRHQAPWARSGEPGQTASPASQRPPLNPLSQEGGKPVSSQSDAGIQRPLESSGHNNSTDSGVVKGVTGTDHCWEQSEDNICRDQGRGTPELSAGNRNVSVDKSEERALKRSKVSRQETRELGDADESGQSLESTTPGDCGRALPLFPLGPALNAGENRKLPSQSSGVIKAVPRAMVATAESAAEILLSIQKQRQQ